MNHKSIGMAVSASMLALALGACGNTIRGAPLRIMNEVGTPKGSDPFEPLRSAVKTYCIKPKAGSVDEAKRDQTVAALRFIADLRYSNFYNRLSAENRGGNFLASTVSIGLTGAGTLAGESAAQTLGAIDTALKGATQAYSKDFLFNQTIPAIQNQMEASRARMRELMARKRRLNIKDYDMCDALSDVISYEQAGTISAAIADLGATTANTKKINENKEEQALRIPYAKGPNQEILERYFFSSKDKQETERRTNLGIKAMAALGLGTTNFDLVSLIAGGSETDRSKLITNLKVNESDANAGSLLN